MSKLHDIELYGFWPSLLFKERIFMKNLKSKLFLSNGNHGDGYEISVEEQNNLDKSRIKTNLET